MEKDSTQSIAFSILNTKYIGHKCPPLTITERFFTTVPYIGAFIGATALSHYVKKKYQGDTVLTQFTALVGGGISGYVLTHIPVNMYIKNRMEKECEIVQPLNEAYEKD